MSLGKIDGEIPEPSVPHRASFLALGSPSSLPELSLKAEGFPPNAPRSVLPPCTPRAPCRPGCAFLPSNVVP